MNIWLILWFILASSLLCFFVWTFYILVRQKAAWKAYADKRNFRYKPGSFMGSPEVAGTIEDHTVTIFSSEHISPNARGTRKLTAIEVSLNSIMPIVGGVASGGMIPILKLLNLKQEYTPKHPDWNKAYVAAGSNRYVLEAYLSDARVAALCSLMQMKHAWVILVFRGDAMLLRVDMPDPLDNPSKVDKIIKQMVDVAKILELQAGESNRLKSEEVKSAAKNVALEVDAAVIDNAAGSFELEDEGGDQENKSAPESASISENEKP